MTRTTNVDNFTNVDASSWGEAIRPSHVANQYRIGGRTTSVRISRSSGAIRANMFSIAGADSTHFSRNGRVSFSDLTSVKEERNATGIDQKKHNVAVAATLNSAPVFRASDGKPMFLQKISSGVGACSINIVSSGNNVLKNVRKFRSEI